MTRFGCPSLLFLQVVLARIVHYIILPESVLNRVYYFAQVFPKYCTCLLS